MKIVELKANNVKRLKAVEIKPNGNMIVIGGKNAQGKSSVLDSIFMGLAGKKAQGKEPVRRGEDQADIVIELDDYTVTRTITSSGSGNVKIETKEGAKFSSPQSVLDALCSKLTFDPLAFMREQPAKQRDMLKDLVGIDFLELDAKRKQAFDDRTEVNRRGKEEKARLDSKVYHEDAPAEEIKISELMARLQAAQEKNKAAENAKNIVHDLENALSSIDGEIGMIKNEIAQFKLRLKSFEDGKKEVNVKLAAAKDNLKTAEAEQVDVAPINEEINGIEDQNKKFRENGEYKELEKSVEKLRGESRTLTEEIEQIDKQKTAAMAEAKFPVAGLEFDENGILFEGFPFSECSSAEQLRVSVAMGIAMNPKLKVLLIRDGSLLDEDNLKMIAEMAAKNDAQVWVERVGKGEECSVIIEDGQIVG